MSATPPADGAPDGDEPAADTDVVEDEPTEEEARADAPAPGAAMTAAAPSTPVPPGGGKEAPVRQPTRRRGIFVDVDELRGFVGDLLRSMLGGYQVDAFGNLLFDHEGARVYVTVGPGAFGPQVGVFSITNVEVDLTGGLAAFLLANNHRLSFGSFSYDAENRAVWLRQTLLGGTLDGPELRATVLSIAGLAARVDDAIADRFGGRRFVDAPEEEQAMARPPEADDEDDDVVNASGYL